MQDVIVVADRGAWTNWWKGEVIPFDGLTPDRIAAYRTVVLAPEAASYAAACNEIIDWKRTGALGATRLILGTYKGRHIWTPENDPFVERWVVHARSEAQVLASTRLAFVPLCRLIPRALETPSDQGYVFMGGRKWRELDAGVAALVEAGLPGRVISDFAPEGNFPNIEINREKVPMVEYLTVMARARVVGAPLKITPISHGHTEVVNAVILGKPVVVTGGCSCDDYVQHGVNGLHVPDNDVTAWARALREAWDRADEFAAASAAIGPDYHTPRYAEYIAELVREVG